MDERLRIDVGTPNGEGEVVASLAGDLDLVSASDVKERLSTALDGAPGGMRLDLSGLDFIDSTGLGTLVALHHHAVAGGVPFRLEGVSHHVRRVMEMTRLDELFEV